MPRQPNPLAPPNDKQVVSAFLRHFGLRPQTPRHQLLRQVAAAFARLPYENLTKIIKQSEAGAGAARRTPAEVLANHVAVGTGGTCFSLTATLLHILRGLGWQAEPILADRPYGENSHCALVVSVDGSPHLLDPGYLICDPIPLVTGRRQQIITPFSELTLTSSPDDNTADLSTVSGTKSTFRIRFKAAPVDAGEFLKAWDASFGWDMMHYPVLTCVRGAEQLYLRGSRLQVRDARSVRYREVARDELADRITAHFGIDPAVTARALTILKHRSSPGGPTSSR